MGEEAVSKKVKKSASSMSFSLSRWFHKISTAEPSSFAITLIIVAYAIFLFGGGLYTIISSPLPAYYTGSTFIFLYPDLGQQFISDSIIAIMLYAIGFVGLLAVYQSTKYAYKPRQAYMTLIIGVALLLLAYIFLEDAILIKLGS
jgi:hypothetical protein